ncbi:MULTISPECIES: hypothetical protein [Roseateles]|uniref:Uncharacterized protein n=1 Tax=Pelomonas caseinilytica TaxID=2906763 RepID=A0ABS8XAG7_9BURK|nr:MULTISPECIES: hypothetical protein [unclassified Roseateles]MCE4535833.1 hypothetical protein [Pelomonas sp. P7]HEV6964295.1 hypothetical protein [Roseateles sp.]
MANDGFGHEVPPRHAQQTHRQVTRYLVVLPTGDGAVARLFLADRTQVAEFDAGTEEVAQLTRGVSATAGAAGPEWNRALASHTPAERTAARVYELEP